MEHELSFSSPGAAGVISELQTIVALMSQIKALGGTIGVGVSPGGRGLGFEGQGKGRGGATAATMGQLAATNATNVRKAGAAERIARDFEQRLEARPIIRQYLKEVGGSSITRTINEFTEMGPGRYQYLEPSAISRGRPSFVQNMYSTSFAGAEAAGSTWSRLKSRWKSALAEGAEKATLARGLRAAASFAGPGVSQAYKSMKLFTRANSSISAIIAADMAISAQQASSSGESAVAKMQDRYQQAQGNARRVGVTPQRMLGDRGSSWNVAGYSPQDIWAEYANWQENMLEYAGFGPNQLKKAYTEETALANYASAWNSGPAYDAMRSAASAQPDPVKYMREQYKAYYGAKPKAEAHRSTLTIFARTEKGG